MAESLVSILGDKFMKPSDLLRELNKAGWPNLVEVSASDFFALILQMGIMPETGADGHTRFFWVGSSRVVGYVKAGFLNLRDWSPPEPSLIELPMEKKSILQQGTSILPLRRA